MVLPTISVANYFIGKAQKEGVEITPMKLIKLVYIAHGWSYPNGRGPLIGESIEAWKFGPVIPSLYRRFKHFGAGNITQQAAEYSDETKELYIPTVEAGSDDAAFLDVVWNAYKGYSGGQLSTLTHRENTPWHEVWVKHAGSERTGAQIPNDTIERHYTKIAAQRNATAIAA